jgi:exosome complex component RRP41
MQMDGHMTMEEFDRALEYGKKACQMVYDVQKDALRRRYAIQGGNGDAEDDAAQGNNNQEA